MVIASGVIDRRAFGPVSESSSSFFSEDLVPTERQVGFWKSESMVDQKGSKSAFTSPLEKVHPMGVNPACGLENPGAQALKGQLDVLNLSNLMGQEENASSLPSISWGDALSSSRSRLGLSTRETAFVELTSADRRVHGYGNSPSSSSFSEVFSSKSRLMASGVLGQSADANNSSCDGDEPLGSMKEIEAQTIGDLLPDDDDLISGVIDGFEYTGLSNQDDADEDIFCTGGGMELENDDSSKGDKYHEGSFKSQLSREQQSINKHPSRALIIKNINASIEDSELRVLFQQFGDVQTLYTCKNHGFVTVSYYDIRSAENAMRALHNKALGLMNLDVQSSIPKEKVPNKYPNNGILVVSIIDSSISNDDLLQILGVYGDVKEIFRAPTSCNKKFVEFYDVRAAEAAVNDLSKDDMSCPKIKVELSHSGGVKSCFTEQCSGEWKQDTVFHQLKNSPPGTIGKLGPKSWEHGSYHNLYYPARTQFNKSLHRFSMNGPQKLSSPIRIESTRQHSNQVTFGEPSGSLGQGKFGCELRAFHPHSLPECHSDICNSSKLTLSARSPSFRLTEGMDYNNHKVSSSDLHGHFSDENEAFGVTGIGSCPLHGHNYTWNNLDGFPQSPSAPMIWSNFQQPMHMHGYPVVPPHMLNTGAHPMDQHHFGSAPNNVGSFANVHSFHPGSLENVGFPGSPQLYPSDLSVFAPTRGNYRETIFSPVNAGFPSFQQIFHATNGRNPMIRFSTSYDATNDQIRSRRHDGNAVQSENKKQFELDIDRIAKDEDLRTTLMIKNIPNKYNCKLLLAVIDENHRGTYDFFYLPIDFKNKCNVGYAFINMTDPQHIIPFYKTFNGKKWEKFNSEKVASLAYARIQGRSALIAHFQNSSLMNEEKWCRPILFHKDGPNLGDQEPFPVGNNVQSRSGRNRPLTSSGTKDGSPSTSPN
ncbi:protein MEI2-like 3 [Phragmites australis]|uniref:protein MEI2-like 3 n=1 Tax=Phragmites australis TaxID=29695 RepID=UPI002D793BFF|nr:protein MEI2-like 3 [Phragmites australis]XP_062230445.1 protein MEI2-like 3 [Phragmites australis]XP_062230446.1 protein MEI2-like 3 [Phragmites australis]XP_062230447.1 protein MEI2-like 3 [Phragmites australis]